MQMSLPKAPLPEQRARQAPLLRPLELQCARQALLARPMKAQCVRMALLARPVQPGALPRGPSPAREPSCRARPSGASWTPAGAPRAAGLPSRARPGQRAARSGAWCRTAKVTSSYTSAMMTRHQRGTRSPSPLPSPAHRSAGMTSQVHTPCLPCHLGSAILSS